MIHLVTWLPLPYQLTLCRALHRAYGDQFVVWFGEKTHKDFPYRSPLRDEFHSHYLSEEGYRKLWRALRSDREAVVILSGWRSPMTNRTLLMTSLMRIPVFIWSDHPHPRLRTWLIESLRRAYLRFLGRRAKGFLVCGSPTREYLASLGIDRTKLTVFPYWVEIPELWTLPSRVFADETRQCEPLRLIVVGRLAEVKRFDVAIEAVALVNERGGCRLADLVVVGDGPERSNLERLVRSLGCESAISFPGWLEIEDVNREVQNADAVMVTSRFEGYGVAVLEAMAAGRAVLASDGVVAALDRDVGNGAVLLHPVGDVECLAKQITLLTSDRERLRKASLAARATAETWPLERAVSIIDEVLGKTKRGRIIVKRKEHLVVCLSSIEEKVDNRKGIEKSAVAGEGIL
jgi:glycosyltransferase involved in cell wall biosynthesis